MDPEQKAWADAEWAEYTRAGREFRDWLRAQNIGTPRDEPAPRGTATCETCGRVMYCLSSQRRFCVYCMKAHATDLQRQRRKARRGRLRCAYCLHGFEPKRTDARYCSPACKQAAYRGRRRAERAQDATKAGGTMQGSTPTRKAAPGAR